MQERIYVLMQQVLAVYFDDFGKGCVQVPRGARLSRSSKTSSPFYNSHGNTEPSELSQKM